MTRLWTPRPHSIHSREELLERGVHPRRLASEEFVRILPGHYCLTSAPAPLENIAKVLQRKVLPGSCLSHVTAAELLGIPVPFAWTMRELQMLHCIVPPGDRRCAGKHVVVHRAGSSSMLRCHGLDVTGLVPTLLGLAVLVDHGRLVACVDHVVGPKAKARTRADIDTLRRNLQARQGSRGVRLLSAAVEKARERVESPMETMLRLLLIDQGFEEPVINLEVQVPHSAKRFRLDLAYPQLKIAIEYDGDGHRVEKKQFQADRRKDDVLHELGWRVVRVTAADFAAPKDLVARLVHLGAPRVR